jgi:HTH-type transcriptional regulator/antitoxin HipB
MVMGKSIVLKKVKHIDNTAELGHYLRASRREQAVTISDASALVSLGERFISEIERGKETAFLDKTLQYINQLGLILHIYPRNTLSIHSPYGALADIKAIGQLARQHRKKQKATLETVKQISGLGLRFLSEFERGNNSQFGKALNALKTYVLEVIISPKNYRLSKADLADV